jgi:hypothetical protein
MLTLYTTGRPMGMDFIGRDAEIEALHQALEQAEAGHG